MRAAPVLVAVLLVAACAGDREREAYVARAEAVCAQARQAWQQVPSPSSPAELPDVVDRLVAVADDAVRRLRALEPPADDAAELREHFLTPVASQVRDGRSFARQLRVTASRGDQAALLRLVAAAPTRPRADLEFLREYGFSACVHAADTSSSL